jgi:hypothetical protein
MNKLTMFVVLSVFATGCIVTGKERYVAYGFNTALAVAGAYMFVEGAGTDCGPDDNDVWGNLGYRLCKDTRSLQMTAGTIGFVVGAAALIVTIIANLERPASPVVEDGLEFTASDQPANAVQSCPPDARQGEDPSCTARENPSARSPAHPR